MRAIVLTGLTALMLLGCGQSASQPLAAGGPTGATRLMAAVPKLDLTASLARFTKFEKRKVLAGNVPMNEGRGAAELKVPLSPEEAAFLVGLYRLHPKRIEPAQTPTGWVKRTAEHLAVLHHFKQPDETALDPTKLQTEMITRCYKDGEGNLLAYESWFPQDKYQLFGKYDLKGRLLKVDMETWD